MSAKALTLTAIVLVFSACQLQADVIPSQWVGAEWGLWDDWSNWYPPIVPDGDCAVTIDSDNIGVDELHIRLLEDMTISQLDCYGKVMLVVWKKHRVELTFRDEDGLTNHKEFMFDGNVEIDGNLHNIAEANMQIKDHLNVWNGEVKNEGLMLVTPGGRLWAENGIYNSGSVQMGLVECTTDGVFNNSDTGVIKGTGGIHSRVAIRNQGSIYAAGGGLGLYASEMLTNSGSIFGNMPNSSLTISPADVNNFGTIEVNAGGGVTFDCNLVNEPNAVIKLLNGTLAAKTITQKAGATFQGFGGITGNVVIEPNAVIKLTGPTNIIGDVTIGEGATLDISDGTVLVTGLTTCNGGTIRIKGGAIITQGGTSGICQTIIVN